jgi:hypothetical protein
MKLLLICFVWNEKQDEDTRIIFILMESVNQILQMDQLYVSWRTQILSLYFPKERELAFSYYSFFYSSASQQNWDTYNLLTTQKPEQLLEVTESFRLSA